MFFNEARDIGDDKGLVEMALEMQDKLDSLRRNLDQPTVGLQVSLPFSVGIDPLAAFKKINNKRKRHLAFIDQLYNVGIRARSIKLKAGKLRS